LKAFGVKATDAAEHLVEEAGFGRGHAGSGGLGKQPFAS
jgi:hypothetical protein